MIPKNYPLCLGGRNPKSKTIQTCLASWQKRLPDYEIIEWNEDKLDLNANKYQQAYQAKKWAFVSDYVRAKALYEMGGIYLDTDVMVLKDFAGLLNDRAFIGFENNDYLSAAIIAAEKGHPLWLTSCTTMTTWILPLTKRTSWPGSTPCPSRNSQRKVWP